MELKLEVMFYAHDKEFNKQIKKHYTTVDRLCDGRDKFKYSEVDIVAKRLFTGLEDQVGGEVYVGDILQNQVDKVLLNWLVVNIGYTFAIKNISCEPLENALTFKIDDPLYFIDRKVIGNIYENPELLENEKL